MFQFPLHEKWEPVCGMAVKVLPGFVYIFYQQKCRGKRASAEREHGRHVRQPASHQGYRNGKEKKSGATGRMYVCQQGVTAGNMRSMINQVGGGKDKIKKKDFEEENHAILVRF